MSRSTPLSISLRRLKRQARTLQRTAGISHCAALDQVARTQGYAAWSLLAARAAASSPGDDRVSSSAESLFQRLPPGSSVLLGSRPRQGKTARAVAVLSAALSRGLPGWFFSLANDAPDLAPLFAACGQPYPPPPPFTFEHSDELSAQTIIDRVRAHAAPRSVIIVDHLQLLDQRRSSPELQQQMFALTAFARQTGCIFLFLSQLRPSLDAQQRLPTPSDIRLPNALDLRLFDQLLFLHQGQERLLSTG